MTDSNLNICKSLKSLTIVKFIIKSILLYSVIWCGFIYLLIL